MSIEEKNKVIAAYDGWKFIKMVGEEKDLPLYQKFDEQGNCIHDGIYHIPEYDKNWNILMPVCHKIDNLYETDISVDDPEVWQNYINHCDHIDDVVTMYEILPVHEAVYQFIQFYNNQDKD